MELHTRRVEIAGLMPHPNAAYMQQCARQRTDHCDEFLLGKRYLIHVRDQKFTEAFDGLLRDSGVEPVVLPRRSPNLNAHCERLLRAITEEAQQRFIILGEAARRHVLREYLAHHHTERNPQGLENHLIAPAVEVGGRTG